MADESRPVDEAFEAMEETILPSMSALLDALLEAAALARPGTDAAVHAAELKTIGCALDDVRRRLEAAAGAGEGQDARAA